MKKFKGGQVFIVKYYIENKWYQYNNIFVIKFYNKKKDFKILHNCDYH